MSNHHSEATVQHLQTLFDVGVVAALSDDDLLEQFARRHRQAAEIAFAALVERHGPMVFRVCRGIVGNPQDAEDAFQATFFILARKADKLWVRDSLAPWLHRVACRAAGRLKASMNRQRAIERRAALFAVAQTEVEVRDDLDRAIHEEVDRLPQYYRLPVVLCDFEGQSYEAASRQLHCPVGTVKSRLARARDRLRRRLVRRGITSSTGAAVSAVLIPEAISSELWKCTIQSVMQFQPGANATAGAFSGSVISLSDGVLKAMLMTRVRTAIAMALVAGIAVTGLGLSVSGGAPEPRKQVGQQAESRKVDFPVAQPATEVKAVSPKTADETEADNEPKRASFRASPAALAPALVLGGGTKIWAYAPKTRSWHTYTARKGVSVQTVTSNNGHRADLVALSYSGGPITEVAVFSKEAGKWIRQTLADPAPIREIRPLVGTSYAVYMVGRQAYAFSAVTGTWSKQALKEPGDDPYIQFGGSSYAFYYDSRERPCPSA